MESIKRREFLIEHIIDKSFIEDVMKSIAWTTLCGAVFAMSINTFNSGEHFQGLIMFAFSTLISTFAIIYVALHIVIPMDSAMYPDDPYWDVKSQKLKGFSKGYEAIKIFITRNKILYLTLSMSYVLYAKKVAYYLAEKA